MANHVGAMSKKKVIIELIMYTIDENDEVIVSSELPQPSPCAPEPYLVGDEYDLVMIYEIDEARTSKELFGISEKNASPVLAIVRFSRCRSTYYGWPNEEALHGHPLYARGLMPSSAAEVKNSSWIRKLEQMNRVHPRHDPEVFRTYRHFIISFQDSTFECVAKHVRVVVSSAVPVLKRNLASILHELNGPTPTMNMI